jgi:hypothetical protein
MTKMPVVNLAIQLIGPNAIAGFLSPSLAFAKNALRSQLQNFSLFGLEYYFRDVSIGFAALDLSDQAYRLHIGVFFGILHGTLNHLLLTDRLWLKRLTDRATIRTTLMRFWAATWPQQLTRRYLLSGWPTGFSPPTLNPIRIPCAVRKTTPYHQQFIVRLRLRSATRGSQERIQSDLVSDSFASA